MTSEPVRKEMTKKLSFTAQRKFVLLVSHVPRMSKLGYHEQSDRGCNAFYPMGTGVGYVTRQWLACMCDACSLWKGWYDETKCENVGLLTIKGDEFLEAKPWEQKTKQDGLSESFKVITPNLLSNLYT